MKKVADYINPTVKNIIKKAIEYIALFIMCQWLSVWIIMVAQYIPNIFGLETYCIITMVLRFIFELLGAAVPLYIFSYQFGYRSKKFKIEYSLVAAVVLVVFQQFIAPCFRYAPYIAGPAPYLADIVYYIKNDAIQDPFQNIITKAYVTNASMHLCMTVIMLLIFVPSIIFGEYIGAKMRKKHEKQLIEYHKNTA